MKTWIISTMALLSLSGCAEPDNHLYSDQINYPCNDKPNCVSSIDKRPEHHVDPFLLTSQGLSNWQSIKAIALTLPGSKLIKETPNYLHITCSSQFLGFIDDLEIQQKNDHLDVRSASRVGYYDFNVNRNRVELLEKKLLKQGYIYSSD
ncbi:TPA: DUF1499 domain-containing protein [Photobacterium damselae]